MIVRTDGTDLVLETPNEANNDRATSGLGGGPGQPGGPDGQGGRQSARSPVPTWS